MCPAHSSGGTLRIPRFGFVREGSQKILRQEPALKPDWLSRGRPALGGGRRGHTIRCLQNGQTSCVDAPSKPHALSGTFQQADLRGNAPRNGPTRKTRTTLQVLAPDRFQVTRVFYEIISTYPTSCPRCGWCGSRKIGMREGNCVPARGLITRKS
jgi:hypothetical protein